MPGKLPQLLCLLLYTGMTLPLQAEEKPLGEMECLLEPNTEVLVSAPVPGIISHMKVQRGDVVKRGQTLAQLMSGVQRAAVELARSRVEFGERKSVRNQELYEKQLISIHEKDEMDTELAVARLELREAQEELKLRTIRSPITGVVVEREADPGEYVGVDPVFTLVNLDPLNVEVIVPMEYFGRIHSGMQGEVYPEEPVGGRFMARVSIIDRVIDPASGTFRVRLVLPNKGYALRAGLKCRVRFVADAAS